MKNIKVKYPKLIFYFIIIQKSTIAKNYKGGLYRFARDYTYQYNNDLIVITDMGSGLDNLIKNLNNTVKDYYIGIESPIKDEISIKNTPDWLILEYDKNDVLRARHIMQVYAEIDLELNELLKIDGMKENINDLLKKFK